MGKVQINSFTDLMVWKKAYKFVLILYNKTKTFPRNERFGLIDQLRRAGVSVPSNIAEAFGRLHRKDRTNFYLYARGSLYEIHTQLLIAKDVGYLNKEDFEEMMVHIRDIGKLINGSIRYLGLK